MKFLNGFLEKTFFQHARLPGKTPEAAGALRAAQVAARGGFNGNADGHTPLMGLFGPFGIIVPCQYLPRIQGSSGR